MRKDVINYPSHEEMTEALDAFKHKRLVSPYSYGSTLAHAKEILFVDWTKNEVTATFKDGK